MSLKLDLPGGTVVRVTADTRSTLTGAWRTPAGDFVLFPYRPVLPLGDAPELDATLLRAYCCDDELSPEQLTGLLTAASKCYDGAPG